MTSNAYLQDKYADSQVTRDLNIFRWLEPRRSWEGFVFEDRYPNAVELLAGELEILCERRTVRSVELRQLLGVRPVFPSTSADRDRQRYIAHKRFLRKVEEAIRVSKTR